MASFSWPTLTASGSGLTSLNADTTAAQLLTVGTAGTDFAITNPGSGSHVLNLPTASAVNRGALSSTDWSTFNSKQATITQGNLTEATSSVLTITGGTSAIIGSGLTIQVKLAATAQSGYLSSTDWNTFNSKQATITQGNLTEATSSVLTITGGTSAIIGSGLTIQVKLAATAQSGYLSSTDWNTFNSKGSGSVTSVTFTGDGVFLSSTPSSAVTTTGTLTAALKTQTAGTFLAGPTSGAAATPTFRALQSPTVQSFTTGTAATYTAPAGVLWLEVEMIGGGGGGGGSIATGAANGTSGGATSFSVFGGAAILTANGGTFGGNNNTFTTAAGGTATISSPAYGTPVSGATGSGSNNVSTNAGLPGAASPFAGGGGGGGSGQPGAAAPANSGAGGGAGSFTGQSPGASGAAGGYIYAIIPAPISATYNYTIGAKGTGGSGTGSVGGNGGDGYLRITEHYQ